MEMQQNKRLVMQFLEGLPDGRADWKLLAEDVDWWIQGMGTVGKEDFRKIAARIGERTRKGEMFLDHLTAEDDRVAVEARSRIEMTDGRVFENTYHFLFTLREGQIVSAREHFDTAYARDFFGSDVQQGFIGSTG